MSVACLCVREREKERDFVCMRNFFVCVYVWTFVCMTSNRKSLRKTRELLNSVREFIQDGRKTRD